MDSLFSTKAPGAGKKSRFTLLPGATPTPEGGLAGIGTDPNNVPYLVHQLPRSVEAITAQAAALAIANGAVPVADLVGVYAETGKLDILAQAVAAHKAEMKAQAGGK